MSKCLQPKQALDDKQKALVLSVEGMVIKQANRVGRLVVPDQHQHALRRQVVQELHDAAIYGVVRSALNYRYDRGANFLTYAMKAITREISRCAKMVFGKRIPTRTSQLKDRRRCGRCSIRQSISIDDLRPGVPSIEMIADDPPDTCSSVDLDEFISVVSRIIDQRGMTIVRMRAEGDTYKRIGRLLGLSVTSVIRLETDAIQTIRMSPQIQKFNPNEE